MTKQTRFESVWSKQPSKGGAEDRKNRTCHHKIMTDYLPPHAYSLAVHVPPSWALEGASCLLAVREDMLYRVQNVKEILTHALNARRMVGKGKILLLLLQIQSIKGERDIVCNLLKP